MEVAHHPSGPTRTLVSAPPQLLGRARSETCPLVSKRAGCWTEQQKRKFSASHRLLQRGVQDGMEGSRRQGDPVGHWYVPAVPAEPSGDSGHVNRLCSG